MTASFPLLPYPGVTQSQSVFLGSFVSPFYLQPPQLHDTCLQLKILLLRPYPPRSPGFMSPPSILILSVLYQKPLWLLWLLDKIYIFSLLQMLYTL